MMSEFRRKLMMAAMESNKSDWKLCDTYTHNDNVVFTPKSLDYSTATWQGDIDKLDEMCLRYGKECFAILVPNKGCLPQNMPKEYLTRGDIWLDMCRLNEDHSITINGAGYNVSSISKADNSNLDMSKFHFEFLNKKYGQNNNTIQVIFSNIDFSKYDYKVEGELGFWGGNVNHIIGNKTANAIWGVRSFYKSHSEVIFSLDKSTLNCEFLWRLNKADFNTNSIKYQELAKNVSYNDCIPNDIFKITFNRNCIENGGILKLYRKIK